MDTNFINIQLTNETQDLYIARRNIFKSIESVVPNLKGRLLDVGCGKMPYREYILRHSGVTEYIGLDIENALAYDNNVKPDVTWDGKDMPFPENNFDCIIGTELLEHCFNPDITIKEIYRVLKPQGIFFFTVPFIWNLHEVPYDAFRYTPFTLKKIFERTGFENISIKAHGGWHTSMAQMIGLWTNRSAMNSRKRVILSKLTKPVIKYLLKKDNKFGHEDFSEGMMVPSLFGTCQK